MCNHITPIIKIVEYCNFSCGFCRYPHNIHKSAMPFSTFKTIIEKVCEYNMSHGYYKISVTYHGGEPLLWGYNNFLSAMELQKELNEKYPQLIFSNSIQTNGSLLNDQWIDFFKNNQFDIGISIDGPKEINFHKGTKDNQIVLENIHKLSQKHCKFGILSVITNAHDGYADKYYDFLVEHNIHSVGLCYCIYDENNSITVDNRILTDFLKRFFILFYKGEYRLEVREFTNIMKLCLGIKTGACTFSQRQQCGNFYSIRTNGDVFFCDPYTLNSPPIGNILSETFAEIKQHPNLNIIIDSAKNSVLQECSHCKIKSICGGGCFRHCFGKNKNAFCDTFKSLYPYIEEIVKSSIKG
ncbi:MAG: radical SAM protein [Paludibacteraceae bacterium]|nr:radical SAM protein [Paludibacteraceae bacterium]